ncbi:glycosyltransferase family 2 protein [bacterium]|nr:glycosyltransferase family 2 protein [bacterium]
MTRKNGKSSPSPTDHKIAVVIPAYRVENHICDVIKGLPDYVSYIVVVDDASPDETAKRVAELKDPRVTLLRHPKNRGVGGAMTTGYRAALKLDVDIVVKMDGDDQMDQSYLPRLIEPLISGIADYAKGNRFLDLMMLRQMPLLRRIGNTGLTFLTKAASGYWGVCDPNNGYTAIRAEALRLIDFSRIHRRYFFESSMLIHLNILRAVVSDVPIPARYGDEASSLRIRRVLWEFPINLFRGLINRIYWRYFMLEFAPQGLFFLAGLLTFLFGAIFGAWRWYLSWQTGIVQSTGTVMISVLPLLMGFELLLQAIVMDMNAVPRDPISNRKSPDKQAEH